MIDYLKKPSPDKGDHLYPSPLDDLGISQTHVEWSEKEPRLIGSRCTDCDRLAFPLRLVCFECGSLSVEKAGLVGLGTLYSYTKVWVSSTRSTPYMIGYVDLDDGVRLLASIDSTSNPYPDCRVRLDADDTSFWFTAKDIRS